MRYKGVMSIDLKNAKVYSDGRHFIAIAHTTRPKRAKRNKPEKEYVLDDNGKISDNEIITPKGRRLTEVEFIQGKAVSVKSKGRTVTRKELFTELYNQTAVLNKRERINKIADGIKVLFEDEKKAKDYVKENIERERRNYIVRMQRMNRIANITPFNYFCTFTFDSEKITEDYFKKRLLQTLQNLHSKKGWLYMGVWERGKDTDRLHFHGLFYIPEMIGSIYEKKDYNTNKKKIVKANVNTYFENKFGRNDFQEIDANPIQKEYSVKYLRKYLTKTNDRVIYSRGLAPMRKLDILEDDVLCGYLDNPYKYVLADDFTVINDGTVEGQADNELLLKMPKAK